MWVGVGTLEADTDPSVVVYWREVLSTTEVSQAALKMDALFTASFGFTYEPFAITEYDSGFTDDDCVVAMHRDNTRGSVLLLYYSHDNMLS